MRRGDLTCPELRRLDGGEADERRELLLEEALVDDGADRCVVTRDGDGETLIFFAETDLVGSRRLLARFVLSLFLITLSWYRIVRPVTVDCSTRPAPGDFLQFCVH